MKAVHSQNSLIIKVLENLEALPESEEEDETDDDEDDPIMDDPFHPNYEEKMTIYDLKHDASWAYANYGHAWNSGRSNIFLLRGFLAREEVNIPDRLGNRGSITNEAADVDPRFEIGNWSHLDELYCQWEIRPIFPS